MYYAALGADFLHDYYTFWVTSTWLKKANQCNNQREEYHTVQEKFYLQILFHYITLHYKFFCKFFSVLRFTNSFRNETFEKCKNALQMVNILYVIARFELE